MVLEKKMKITVLPYIGREFNISFDLFVSQYTTSSWLSVIHFTIGGNKANYGDRTPALYISPKKKLFVCSAITINGETITNYGYYFFHQTVLQVKNWINMEISQTLINYKARRQV